VISTSSYANQYTSVLTSRVYPTLNDSVQLSLLAYSADVVIQKLELYELY
jgi:hypothetical protein